VAERGRRGPYAKTVAKRAEILAVALEEYASSGRQGPPLKTIAERVGLSEAGVLHHFASKDHLLVEVLRARDQAAVSDHDLSGLDGLWDYLRHVMRTPGLIKLYVDMSAAAADPEHPAHAFLKEHRENVLAVIRRLIPPARQWQAPVLLAAAEGFQIQWVCDPSVDVVGELQRLHEALGDAPVALEPAS
jgi:AcrR family transcriptional regulator